MDKYYMNLIFLLIAFIVVLFLYNSLSLVENMDNNDEKEIAPQTIIYQNQGAILNLQKQVEKIMNQITSSVNTDAKQNAQLQTLSSTLSNTTKISNAADALSKSNKAALVKIANAQKQKAQNFKNKASKLPPIK